MKCPKCGRMMPPGADECPFCGFKVDVESLVERAFPETPDDGTNIISNKMAGVLIVVIIVALIAIFMLIK